MAFLYPAEKGVRRKRKRPAKRHRARLENNTHVWHQGGKTLSLPSLSLLSQCIRRQRLWRNRTIAFAIAQKNDKTFSAAEQRAVGAL